MATVPVALADVIITNVTKDVKPVSGIRNAIVDAVTAAIMEYVIKIQGIAHRAKTDILDDRVIGVVMRTV